MEQHFLKVDVSGFLLKRNLLWFDSRTETTSRKRPPSLRILGGRFREVRLYSPVPVLRGRRLELVLVHGLRV